jgi:hypothetical protein
VIITEILKSISTMAVFVGLGGVAILLLCCVFFGPKIPAAPSPSAAKPLPPAPPEPPKPPAPRKITVAGAVLNIEVRVQLTEDPHHYQVFIEDELARVHLDVSHNKKNDVSTVTLFADHVSSAIEFPSKQCGHAHDFLGAGSVSGLFN